LIACLLIILLSIFILPLFVKKIEENLEIFLFIMGVLAVAVAKLLNLDLIIKVLTNKYMYFIVAAVFLGGLLFKFTAERLSNAIGHILNKIPIQVFVFILVVILGLISSVITAIISALFLVEIINKLPLDRKTKIKIDIVSCFSIGLGAVLTPIGEPLSTIVVSKLNVDFWYMLNHLGIMIIPGIVFFALLAAIIVTKNMSTGDNENVAVEKESYKEIIIRAAKIFLFIIALDFLGEGFKPIIDTYIIKLNGMCLYWLNMVSAILDNATLASAEISAKMTAEQITAILMGLLISGGMMVPGNIPNIISASKLKITSKEWIKLGVPLGLIVMAVYFVIIFFII
jgi:predicted cation transporter